MQRTTFAHKKENFARIPQTYGVYLYKQAGEIVYVGKSINLRARIKGHWEAARYSSKERGIVAADTIEIITTASEFEALIVEAHYIKQYRPKYNVSWRDDKSFVFIKIPLKDTYPKITLVRQYHQDSSTAVYFGPFKAATVAVKLLRMIRKIVPFCTSKRITKTPCFYSKIGLCYPCPNVIEQVKDENVKKTLQKHYKANIKKVVKLLKGHLQEVRLELQKQLTLASKEERFEDAIEARNKLIALDSLLSERFITTGSDLQELTATSPQKDMEELNKLLSRFFPGLPPLQRIECYDISHLMSKDITASMVVMLEGRMDKSEYKKFRIKNPQSVSDFDRLQEVFRRRFNHPEWGTPDLLVVDGGKPQVRAVLKTLAELGLTIPLIGIAKNPDRLIIAPQLETVRIGFNNRGFNLIRVLRDESHRFAKAYHTLLRDKRVL